MPYMTRTDQNKAKQNKTKKKQTQKKKQTTTKKIMISRRYPVTHTVATATTTTTTTTVIFNVAVKVIQNNYPAIKKKPNFNVCLTIQVIHYVIFRVYMYSVRVCEKNIFNTIEFYECFMK